MLLAAAWSAAIALSGSHTFVDAPALTPSRAGGLLASWSWQDGTRRVVRRGFETSDFTRRREQASALGQITAYGRDRLVALVGAEDRVAVAFGRSDGRFGAPRTVAFGRDLRSTTVAANARGDIAVAWFDDRGTANDEVRVAVRRPGRRFGRPVLLARGRIRSASVAVGQRGQVLVAWDARGTVRTRVLGERTRTIRSEDAYFARLRTLITPSGRMLVGWTAQFLSEGGGTGPRFTQVAVRPAGRRSFRKAQLLARDDTFIEGEAGALRLAVDTRGVAIAAWTSSGGVQAATAGADGFFGPVQTIAPAGDVGDLATGPKGDALLVWDEGFDPPDGTGDLFASYRPPGGVFGPPEPISVGRDAHQPAAAFDAVSGRPTVIWSHRETNQPPTVAAASSRME